MINSFKCPECESDNAKCFNKDCPSGLNRLGWCRKVCTDRETCPVCKGFGLVQLAVREFTSMSMALNPEDVGFYSRPLIDSDFKEWDDFIGKMGAGERHCKFMFDAISKGKQGKFKGLKVILIPKEATK